MKITLDTDTDTYEGALATVRAAFGVTPPSAEGTTPEDDDLDDIEFEVEEEGDDYLPGNWTRRKLRKVAEWVAEDAAEALRFIAANAPAVDIEKVIEHMAKYTEIDDFGGRHMGGRMSSVGFAQNAIKGVTATIYDTDYRHRKYRMHEGIAKVLLEELGDPQ
jgi:hypothetical protein